MSWRAVAPAMTGAPEAHTGGQDRPHRLDATPRTVHWGHFDASRAPVLRVASGDLVDVRAVTHHAGDAPELMMDAGIEAIYRGVPPSNRGPGGHILTGPIHVDGAVPGGVLEVRYLRMTPRRRHGSNVAAAWGELFEATGRRTRVTIYELDPGGLVARGRYAYDVPDPTAPPGTVADVPETEREPALAGVRVPVRPHLGVAGVAPDAPGRVSSVPPGRHGGNVDDRRIGAGATVFYPVEVPGARFSVGDPHLGQGDGELCGTAIEGSLDVRMQLVARPDIALPSPLIQTPDDWIVHGFGDDLDGAMHAAARHMLEFLTAAHGLSCPDAYSLMSVAVDFAVTQVVNGTKGVHARIARHVLPPRDV